MNFRAAPHTQMLKGFQRRTVAHVTKRMFDDTPPARRFLVADETGLGKSLVARGVIAETIERLQFDDSVQRIDIVYVCSNGDIARQNLARLDVLGTGATSHSTRLTLLARDSGELNGEPDPKVGKRVNLISFTPTTSFDVRYGGGRSDERVLLYRILADDLWLDGFGRRALAALLQGWVRDFDAFYRTADSAAIQPDPAITKPFLSQIRTSGLRRRVIRDIDRLGRRTRLTDSERAETMGLVGELRAALAKAGVAALEPDLVILDEFQRFRHLLDANDPTSREAAELAHALFDYGDARVLLLSATPYKPFTYAEEAAVGDDHEADLRKVLGFLDGGNGGSGVDGIVSDLAEFRRCAVEGSDAGAVRRRLELQLTQLMCRTERPRLGDAGMLAEHVTTVEAVTPEDVTDYAVIKKIATAVDSHVNVDYWKSTPYFLNFADGYQLGDRLKTALANPDEAAALRPVLRSAQRLDRDRVEQFTAIDPGNARMRQLTAETVGADWWQLLWMPPSLPYQPPGGPFATVGPISKRLVFSSWAATPTAIASLLSHDATRRMVDSPGKLDTVARRLDWRIAPDGRPSAMTTLMLFWPLPRAALATDPRVRCNPLRGSTGHESLYWGTLLANEGSTPAGLTVADAVDALTGRVEADEPSDGAESSRLSQHVDLALHVLSTGRRPVDDETRVGGLDADDTLAAVATYSPANIAYRAVNRIAGMHVSDSAQWRAAALIASGFRTLFNRPETASLLDQLLPGVVYWRAVLSYCAWGNLEATLDEYLHHLSYQAVADGMTDERLIEVASKVNTAITLRPAPYEAFDPLHPSKPIVFSSRFALRYGNKRATGVESSRQPDIQDAFNSPFWPFVLATTSIGQEGIDLHWWCHATCHWNTPASPVDFEQREGRVSRYGGLAIRRNLAHLHTDELLARLTNGDNLWPLAYGLGSSNADDRFDELAPHWICNGPTKVERRLFPYPLSSDRARYDRLKEDLVLYRLTFGQPRQEDLLELLRRRGVGGEPDKAAGMRLDLRPPAGLLAEAEASDAVPAPM